MANASSTNENQKEKLIRLLEEQLAHSNQQNKNLSKQIEALTEQVRHLTKLLYGSKTEKSKYNVPDGQGSLFDDDLSFSKSEHTEKQSQQTISYTVVRKIQKKKRNDSLRDDIEVEAFHHYPEITRCDCCQGQMIEIGSTIVREEAKFIPAKMKKVQHIEYAYECKNCKGDTFQKAHIKRGKAPHLPIQRSVASPSVLAKVMYDKFSQYLPPYRQVKEWNRYGMNTNDKNLSNWVIRASHDCLLPIYERMKHLMMAKSILHVDETYAQIINRSDGKSGQSNVYNWVYRSVPSQGPTIVLFQSSLSRARSVLENFTEGYSGTIVCDGYSAYDKMKGVTFANCWAHVRRYWLKADSKNGRIGVSYCDDLYRLERKFKHLSPSKRRKNRQKYTRPIVDKFLEGVEASPFYGKNALAKAAEYTLNRANGLRAFLNDGRFNIGTSIQKRPSEIKKRETFGHWELDTIVSSRGKSKGCFATFIERKTRYYQAIVIPDRTAESMEFAIKQITAMYSTAALQTATVDRGKEFSCYQRVEKDLGIAVFFADPYSSWQRGSNENVNGLLREFYPKKNRFEPCFTRTIESSTASY